MHLCTTDTTDLEPFNAQETEHVGDMRQVVVLQRICIQVLTERHERGGGRGGKIQRAA